MLAVLKLEFIAENYHAYTREVRRETIEPSPRGERYGEYLGRDMSHPWVARITGTDSIYGLAREFVRGQIDYSRANSTGSRGVYIYYPLKDGIYEVNRRETWHRVRRYFIRVQEATIEEISREEVIAWLSRVSVSASYRPLGRG